MASASITLHEFRESAERKAPPDVQIVILDEQSLFLLRSPVDPAVAFLFDRQNCSMQVAPEVVAAAPPEGAPTKTIHAIIGVIRLIQDNFLAVVTGAVHIGNLLGGDVFGVTKVELLPFVSFVADCGEDDATQQAVADMERYLSTEGFYFSHDFNLTQTAQRMERLGGAGARKGRGSDWEEVDVRFAWNCKMTQDFKNYKLAHWLPPLTQGHVQVERVNVKGREVRLALISRRSWRRAGTRFVARGIDTNADVQEGGEGKIRSVTLLFHLFSPFVRCDVPPPPR
jgi:phosphatidylinositol 4-phosphatase